MPGGAARPKDKGPSLLARLLRHTRGKVPPITRVPRFARAPPSRALQAQISN